MNKLKNPPVVEVVLGVQFQTLPRMTSAHYGVFWTRHLDVAEWTEANDAPALPEQFESFGDRPLWGSPQVTLKLSVAEPRRVQFRSADGERIVQIQPNRFVYNWQRRTGEYPSYDKVRDGFETYFGRFEHLVREYKLGPLLPNQWEVTYVDRVTPGPLWEKPADWYRVIPGLLSPPPVGLSVPLGSVNGEWHYELPDNQGGIHLALGQGAPETLGGGLPLMLHTTVRGPIGEAGIDDWKAGFELGHRTANDLFRAVVSDEAKKVWGVES
jgi:uncharacterized protein (TIGR04255 family)